MLTTILLFFLPAVLGQESVFCSGLGTFDQSPPFEGWPLPTCPYQDPSLELVYTIYRDPDTILGQEFDRNEVPIIFDPTLDTLFLAHGWTSSEDDPLLDNIRDEVLSYQEMNVVVIGWGGPGGSQNLNYWESASTTRTVGAETAEVMANLINNGGGQASKMRCAGHSLGAHVCGHFGRWAAGNGQRPGRVTGMDPAGPNFALNTDRTVGIYRDCGDFVDIMHTDSTLGSTPEPGSFELTLGHQDFYPNNGEGQPGCDSNTCDHIRVVNLFAASVNPLHNCFTATMQCTASNDLPGSCSPCTSCPEMGFRASAGDEGMFYLPTGGTGDFCL